MMLVSLEQASEHLRRDSVDDDADLTLKIEAASEIVMTELGTGSSAWTDSAGDVFVDSSGDALNVPRAVQAATLLMIGYLYKDRDSDPTGAYAPGMLPRPVTALLFPLKQQVFG